MLRASHLLQLTVIALLGLGTVVVHSAGVTVGSTDVDGRFFSFVWDRQILYAVLAISAMWLASRFDIRQLLRLRGLSSPILWLSLLSLGLVVLAMVPGWGRSVNGASRWLYLGPRSWGISFQPSELVKWAMVLAMAVWCTRHSAMMPRFRWGLLPPMVLVGVSCGLIMIEDLGTGVLIGIVAVCCLIAGGARLWHMAMLIPPAAAACVVAVAHSPYRVARLMTFLDPWSDPLGRGYHPIQSMVAIAQGGLAGRGLGNGIQKFGYLPEDTTDFIFAVVCEELGMAGGAVIISLYMLLLWAGLAILRDCKDTFGRMLVLGVLLTIGFQAIFNIAVVTVLLPTKGIALPLVSAGGTGWVLTAAALGLVVGLDREEEGTEV